MMIVQLHPNIPISTNVNIALMMTAVAGKISMLHLHISFDTGINIISFSIRVSISINANTKL